MNSNNGKNLKTRDSGAVEKGEIAALVALRPPPNDLSNLIRHDVICNCFNRMKLS